MNPTKFWPELPLNDWKPTYETLHRWVQIPGKIRLKLSPLINHWWEVAYYVTARGLTTSAIYTGNRSFQIDFDFIDHTAIIRTSDGLSRILALAPKSVAFFYQEITDCLASLDLHPQIDLIPSEIPNPIPFHQDTEHAFYDREYAHRHWRILLQVDRLMKKFRSRFIGKCSPVHFFWGSFDMAVTRFSGRRAPERPQTDSITREAYSHEVISHGFWPGSGNVEGAAFYAYAAPEPPGFSDGPVQPPQAFYNAPTRGYILMYDDVRKVADPDRMVLDFFQSTYELGANLGQWDRAQLERQISAPSAKVA